MGPGGEFATGVGPGGPDGAGGTFWHENKGIKSKTIEIISTIILILFYFLKRCDFKTQKWILYIYKTLYF